MSGWAELTLILTLPLTVPHLPNHSLCSPAVGRCCPRLGEGLCGCMGECGEVAREVRLSRLLNEKHARCPQAFQGFIVSFMAELSGGVPWLQ